MYYDSHTHTTHSDGRSTVDEMCLSAIERGIQGLALTDHANMNYYEERDTYRSIIRAGEEITAAKERYKGQLQLTRGVELGEYLYAPDKAKEILSLGGFDVILCSVHLVPKARWPLAYNRIIFSEDGTDEELRDYLRLYFDLLNETVDQYDYDVLAHITCPVRYMTGKYKRKTDVMIFEDKIREILKRVIDKNVALEFNTAGLCSGLDYFNSQNEEVLRIYRELGGKLITLGSDAHQKNAIARGFDLAIDFLRSCGFDSYCYYENRIPKHISI